jgi:hypothetical protein
VSEDALKVVRACTHPQVKRGVRDLYEAIADLIPDGQTTTPPIGMKELAEKARLHRVTGVSRLKVLVDIKEIGVLDAGQGRTGARYTMLRLAGEPPVVEVPLPLRADLRPVPRPRTDEATTPLPFDAPGADAAYDQTTKNLLRLTTSWPRQLVAIGYKFRDRIANLLRLATSWVWHLLRSATSAHPLAVDDARARDVHTLKDVHTPAAAPRDGPDPPAPRHPWHAWCGRVCVPIALHQEFQRKGHDGFWLTAFYARTCAALPVDEKITANDFSFWRAALKAALAAPSARAPAGARSTRPTFGAGSVHCPHDPRCRTIGDCTERILREAREERTG